MTYTDTDTTHTGQKIRALAIVEKARVVTTPALLSTLGIPNPPAGLLDVAQARALAFVYECIARHHAGDWGDVDPDDRGANDASLIDGSRLLSVYKAPAHTNPPSFIDVWIITDATDDNGERAYSTIMLPSDY